MSKDDQCARKLERHGMSEIKVESVSRPNGQLSKGQGKIERHEFYSLEKHVGFIVAEQWPESGLLILSGEMRAFDKRQKTGSRMIAWLMRRHPELKLKPVCLTYEGSLFWQKMVKLYPEKIDRFDFCLDEYQECCELRAKGQNISEILRESVGVVAILHRL